MTEADRDGDSPFPGVESLEHTADVGLEIRAPTLAELFVRASRGTMWLVLGHAPREEPTETRTLQVTEEDLPALLRSWLRELLFWQETEGFITREVSPKLLPMPSCGAEGGQALGIQARVKGNLREGPVEREIKGVTLHGLAVEEVEEGWFARVIFDV